MNESRLLPSPSPSDEILLADWKIRKEVRNLSGEGRREVDCKCEIAEPPLNAAFPYPVPKNCQLLNSTLMLFCDQRDCCNTAIICMQVKVRYDLDYAGIDMDGLEHLFLTIKEETVPVNLCMAHFKPAWHEACWDCAKLFVPGIKPMTRPELSKYQPL